MQAPKKISLAAQAAEILKAQILDKRFENILPGETPLAANLHVSRKTVREALAILESDGVISAAEPGKRREIILTAESRETRQKSEVVRILLPSPLKEMHGSAQNLFRAFVQHLRIDEEFVEFHNLPYASAKSDIRTRLHELIDCHPCSLWVVFELTTDVASVMMEKDVNAIACGGVDSTEIPVVSYHGASAVQHALNKLIRKGHTRIVPLRAIPTKEAINIEPIFNSVGIPFDAEYHCPHYEDSASGLNQLLTRLFKNQSPPTAFITSSPRDLISLITWLAHKKLSVPEDVSILHIGSEPLLEAIFPKISYYSTNSAPIARELARLSNTLLLTPNKKLEHKYFYMEYQAGESLGTAKS